VQGLVEALGKFSQGQVGLFCQPLLQLLPRCGINAGGGAAGALPGRDLPCAAHTHEQLSTKEMLTPNSAANLACEPIPRSYACKIFWRKSREYGFMQAQTGG
jgi:hypothetical protein